MSVQSVVRALVVAAFCTVMVHGQGSSTTTDAAATSLTTSFATTTIVETIPVVPSGSGTRTQSPTSFITTTVTTTVPVTFPVAAASSSAEASPTPTPILLDTHVDPAFGVLGVILIITGIPTAFLGHKNRWSSFFIVGFYTLALVTLSLILKFGVLNAINPPSKTLRGLFVLSCAVAGFVGGGIGVLLWKASRFVVGAWGGLALAFWIQCFHTGGLIRPIGFRWLFYIACATVGFVACTFPKWHYHVMLISTAFVGASAFILGVDCYASSGLKEFYVFNLGFNKLFPKFNGTGVPFQLTQVMQILLGLIAAIFLMGAAVQLRVLAVLRKKLKEISDEEKRREEEVEARAAERFDVVNKDLERWEKEHGRTRSNLSSMPLLGGDGHAAETPGYNDGRNSSQFSLPAGAMSTARAHKALADSKQTPGALPTLDLGDGIQNSIPQDFVAADGAKKPLTAKEEADLAQREELLAEIQTIRHSIDVLRSTTGTPLPSMGSDGRPRVQSFGQSLNELETRFTPADRPRVHSMDMYNTGSSSLNPSRHVRTTSTPLAASPRGLYASNMEAGSSISRPTSTPMRDDWEAYTRERTIVTPGVTSPLQIESPAPRRSSLFAIPTAVTDALLRRQKRESVFLESGTLDPPTDIEMGRVQAYRDAAGTPTGTSSSDNVPLAQRSKHRKSGSAGHILPPQLRSASPVAQTTTPVHVLPPQRKPTAQTSNSPAPRTATFEELTARHREKLRTLQAPLSAAEREQAELQHARERWERSRKIEKKVMERKELDAAAKVAREDKDRDRPRRRSGDDLEQAALPPSRRHQRTMSADKLGGGSSRRLSTMKVEDWQQYQSQYDGAATDPAPTSASRAKRDTRVMAPTAGDVPFPGRRRSRSGDELLRDPPS